MIHLETAITAVGPEVAALAEGGVLILFADGAPPELAEVSVLHRPGAPASAGAPPVGASVRIGALEARLTAIGDAAWAKVRDMGHVVITFNGAAAVGRPGEICATSIDGAALVAALQPGAGIAISS